MSHRLQVFLALIAGSLAGYFAASARQHRGIQPVRYDNSIEGIVSITVSIPAPDGKKDYCLTPLRTFTANREYVYHDKDWVMPPEIPQLWCVTLDLGDGIQCKHDCRLRTTE